MRSDNDIQNQSGGNHSASSGSLIAAKSVNQLHFYTSFMLKVLLVLCVCALDLEQASESQMQHNAIHTVWVIRGLFT